MRNRIPGRVLTVGVLLALLCLVLSAGTHVASAKPIGWDGQGPPTPNGDNDGVVVKAGSMPTATYASSGSMSGTTSKWMVVRGEYRGLLALVRLGYWRLLIR